MRMTTKSAGFSGGKRTWGRKSARLNSSHTDICPHSQHAALPISLKLGMGSRSGGQAAGHLADADDDELRRLQRGEADVEVHDAAVDVVLRRGLAGALDEGRTARRGALEGALPEQARHERVDVQAELAPQRLVVALEDRPLRPALQAFLAGERHAPPGQVLLFAAEAAGAAKGAGAPDDAAGVGEGAQAVD